MQYIPCNSALLAQKALFLPKKALFMGCVAFATQAFATPILVASATPIFVASATPYFRTFATRTAATPNFFLIFHLFKRLKMTNFSLEVVMDEVLDM